MTDPALPSADELLASAVVVSLPMRVRFRGITRREVLLVRGPVGWGEFGAFPEYEDDEAAHWLRSAIESAWVGHPPAIRSVVPVNATVPAVDPDRVPEVLARFPGAQTAKVKVAEPGQD
ncbi:MAG: o-succinylbenzoate synthase, partial [Rhodococcus sp. (in: high G+C Gram-positive bacteria)]